MTEANTDLAEFITEQLTVSGVRVRGIENSGPNLQAWCFEGHDHKTPSLSIRKSDGAFYCFGCGVRGKNWNVLAARIGAARLKDKDLPDQFKPMHEGLNRYIESQVSKLSLPWDVEPWDEPKYRGLPLSFLQKVNALKWYDDGTRTYRILLPIQQRSKLVGWVARRLDKQQFMRYKNCPGLPAKQILYPYDFVDRHFNDRVVVLVEGPFDALRLCRHHIPALAIMGTNNYTKKKQTMLYELGRRTKRVIICTDADDAGKKCRYETLDPMLREYFAVEHYFPPANKDPGNMPMDCIRELRDQVRNR